MLESYAFEVLPVHPPPYPLESFTSYLVRLATLNGIRTSHGLRHLFFPNQYVRLGGIVDAPLRSFGRFPMAAGCSEATLLTTTFHHLTLKFGRTNASLFLSSSVAPCLRYCPNCLQEHLYYRLPWRFTSLGGCPQHGRQLLDSCTHCGQPVPFLKSPIQIGQCSLCGSDLRDGHASALNEVECRVAYQRYEDLTYLLRPQSWETENTAVQDSFGPWLKWFRQERGIQMQVMNRDLHLPRGTLRLLEHPQRRRRGTDFKIHLAYADYLGLGWHEVFLTLARDYSQQPFDVQAYKEQRLVEKVQKAIGALEQTGQPVNSAVVGRLVGMDAGNLKRYPRVKAILVPLVSPERLAALKQQHEQNLLERVQAALEQLEASDQRPTQSAIASIVGMSATNLHTYPRVKRWLADLTERETRAQPLHPDYAVVPIAHRHEQQLLGQAQDAVQHLIAQGQPVSLRRVAQALDLSAGTICTHHPQLHTFIGEATRQWKADHHRQRETELLQRVQTAITQLESDNQPVTQKTVARLTGFARSSLYHYPRVAVRLRQIPGRSNSARHKRLQRP